MHRSKRTREDCEEGDAKRHRRKEKKTMRVSEKERKSDEVKIVFCACTLFSALLHSTLLSSALQDERKRSQHTH